MSDIAKLHQVVIHEANSPHPDPYASQWHHDLRRLVLLVYAVALEGEEAEYQARRAAFIANTVDKRRSRRRQESST